MALVPRRRSNRQSVPPYFPGFCKGRSFTDPGPRGGPPVEKDSPQPRKRRGMGRGFWIGLVGAALGWGGWLWIGAEPTSPAEQTAPPELGKRPPVALPKAAEPLLLQEQIPVSAVLNLAEEGMLQFRVHVPKEALLAVFQISRCPVPIDLLVKKGEPIHSPEEADYQFTADVLENTLRISRQSTPPLQEGDYYLTVAHLGNRPVVVHKRPVGEIPFTITFLVVRPKPASLAVAGEKYTGQIRAEEGSIQTWVIDVPAEAPALRIDLDEVSGDLDLWARFGQPAYRQCEASHTAISPMGRESLLITPQSPEPLRPGRWYLHVVHPLDEGVVDFSFYVNFSIDPPEQLLKIPELACPEEPIKRAIAATVEVATEYGAASGTLLTPTGLVLTNYHVVAEVADNPPENPEQDPVIIAVTVDPALPPKELFRSRVVRFDKERDLALVQITCGLYHQPLPKGYRFPPLRLGDPAQMQIGDEVRIVGFPSVGGSGGRVSVTLTRGILSGWEKSPIGVLMKTDALIAPGSSGGAALDSQGRLIGVPTSENVLPEVVGRMSYIHPLSLLPEEWQRMILSLHPKADSSSERLSRNW